MPFSGQAPSKQNFFQQKSRVGYVYIEESFDTIFNMGYGGGWGRTLTPSPMDYGSENWPWTRGFKVVSNL